MMKQTKGEYKMLNECVVKDRKRLEKILSTHKPYLVHPVLEPDIRFEKINRASVLLMFDTMVEEEGAVLVVAMDKRYAAFRYADSEDFT